jgi:phenylalanyl-tRNA synthetase beta chain
MRVPLSWLREFAPTDMNADELVELMTPRGVLVEDVLRPWDGLEGVVVARVLEVRDHPNSDKLCIARIQHGSGETELVVGVRNMGAGDLVPWAPPGARVPGLPDPLGAREIRGVISSGMLCSARELGISQDHGGILLLNDEGWDVGADVKGALGLADAVLDIEIEPNRPDFLSIYGVAREVAAATGVLLTEADLAVVERAERAADAASVRIDAPEACPRYAARVIRGVSAGRTPLWAQARLTACGMRPISAVVDATNYAMLELGQPLHAFDMDRLVGPGIVVRRAADGELVRTLDDVERTLTDQDLLICDLERPVAIAGVMGGQTSEVSEDTTNVLLESAYFTRGGVLLTARRLDLHTEASHRFERGTDPEGTDPAASRCAALIDAWAGGEVLAGLAAAGEPPPRRRVPMRAGRASALLGYAVSTDDALAVFGTLGMHATVDDDTVEVEVPGYRVDIEREVDLIEEVVRIQGYGRVGSHLPRAAHAGGLPDAYAFARRAKDALVRAGLREIRPAPFVSEEDLALSGDQDAVRVANPLRAEEAYLRTRLTPGLLHAIARNQALGVRSAGLYEVGIVFRLGDPTEERRKIAFALAGAAGEGWAAEKRPFDVLDARGVLEALMDDLGVGTWSLGEPLGGAFHPGRSAFVLVEEARAGIIAELHPRAAERFEIDGRVAICELEFEALRTAGAKEFVFREVPRFPPVRRDLAFVLPEDAPAGAVQAAIEEAAGDLLGGVVLFDVFRGGSLPEGKKSLAFAVDFRAADRTLTADEAEPAVDRIVARLATEFSAELRAG